MFSILKLIGIFLLAYILLSIVKFVMYIGRSADAARKSQKKRDNIRENRAGRSGNKIIELDKDQYKVE